MQKEVKEALRIRFKLAVLESAREIGSATKACCELEVPRSTFYDWEKAFDKEEKAGLVWKKPVARNHPRKLAQDVTDQILHLRQTYILGPELIT